MPLTRRGLIVLSAGLALPALTLPRLAGAQPAASPASPPAAPPAAADPRLGERSVGNADAPVRVLEFFSLTCSHCAAFHKETWPAVKRELVEKGEIRFVWRDFPLDAVALKAAMVARSLPAERYEAFTGTLLSTQDRWAFGANPDDGLARVAALAGMPRAQFDQVVADEALRRAILEQRLLAEREFTIQATPSFVFGSKPTTSGNMTFERFAQLAREARG